MQKRMNMVVACAFGLGSVSLHGAGFQLAERSVSGLGRAFSGEAAIGDDASVLSSNPAGAMLFDNHAFSAGVQYINPSVDVDGMTPSGPARDADVVNDAWIPYFYYLQKLNERWALGLGVFSSFGLSTEYSESFASMAGTEKSEILTLTVNPSVAYRVNDCWSFGFGLNLMYAEGELTALNTATDPIPGPVGSKLFDLEGDDWGYGWNFGVLYELSEDTRFGLHYRSAVDLKLEGEASGAIVGGSTRDAELEIELPDSVEFSVYHQLNQQWALHADVMWTGWGKFQSLEPVTGTPADGALAVEENWQDVFRYAVGATYAHDDRWTFRAGLAFDEGPVGSDSDRTLRIPDGDRVWASIGASVRLNECYSLDLAYTHLFAGDTNVEFAAQGGNEAQFAGEAKGDVDLFGIGVRGTF